METNSAATKSWFLSTTTNVCVTQTGSFSLSSIPKLKLFIHVNEPCVVCLWRWFPSSLWTSVGLYLPWWNSLMGDVLVFIFITGVVIHLGHSHLYYSNDSIMTENVLNINYSSSWSPQRCQPRGSDFKEHWFIRERLWKLPCGQKGEAAPLQLEQRLETKTWGRFFSLQAS